MPRRAVVLDAEARLGRTPTEEETAQIREAFLSLGVRPSLKRGFQFSMRRRTLMLAGVF